MKLSNIRIFLTSRKSWTLPYIIFSAFFVVLPLILIVVFAFTDERGNFTFANFAKFMSHPEAVNTFIYSIGIAIINTLICILLVGPRTNTWKQATENINYVMIWRAVTIK